ncbi:long-chain fatty acid--CoA ligase [Crossiella sp. SN42]|uniref:AMP-dependent synthetase/ligase n=1 Tax=Crossiella sp. SN42 TaxID=2944808 RepID=UPI00207C7380|nr:long-chain fatty acid--CoA ligase [Crossiella sp. SN42]MCO1574648.1 long-chain fatty acid--CoA ligase [Crossiella sp. SN42]
MREFTAAPRYPVPAHGGVVELVYGNAAAEPGREAFRRKVDGRWVPVTAGEFAEQVTAVARGLLAGGIAAGDRVGLLSSTRYEWTLLDFALWAVGAVPVPVYVTSSAEQIQWILADSGAAAVLVETAEHEAVVDGLRPELPELGRLWRIEPDATTPGAVAELVAAGERVAATEVVRRRRLVDPADVATIIYTSGTTGRPKGCVLTHANCFAEAGNAVELLRPMFEGVAGEGASTLLFLPLAHVFGRMVQLGAVLSGAVLGHSGDIKSLLADLATFRPTFVLSVPYVLEKVYNTAAHKAHAAGRGRLFESAVATAIAYSEAAKPGLGLRIRHALFDRLVYRKLRAAFGGRCRYAISGGAPLGARLTHFYRGIGLTVFEGYGLTETTAAATLNSLDAYRPGTVGRPVPGTSVRISEDGEVLIKGGVVFPGYWHDETATAQAFPAQDWFATGDLGELDEDGFLRITGRKKEILVTSGGKNVAPAVIEDRITAHPLIAHAVVVGDAQKYIAALITIDQEHFPQWKTRAGKPETATVAELADDPDLRAEIQQAIDSGNQAVSTAESVRRFRVLPAEFTPETGHLTPSLKLRRAVIMQDFAEDVAGLYA